MYFNQLLSFTKDRVLEKSITEHLFGAISWNFKECSKRKKMSKYLFEYAKSNEILSSNRPFFYDLVNKLDTPVSEEDQSDQNINSLSFNSIEQNELRVSQGLEAMQESVGEEINTDLFNGRLEDEEEVNGGVLYSEEQEEGTESEVFEEEEATEDFFDLTGKDQFDEEPFEEEEEFAGAANDFNSLNGNFNAAVPPYYFKTKKQKRKLFNKINNKYFQSIKGNPTKKIEKTTPKVKFNLMKTQIQKFKKDQVLIC